MNRYLGAYEFDEKNLTQDLYVESAGCYNLPDSDYCTRRALGTHRYFLVYVHHGTATVCAEKRSFELHDGGFLLYPPACPQELVFRAAEGSAYFWICFGGNFAPSLLHSLGLTQFCFFANARKDAAEIFNAVIAELQYHRSNYALVCQAHLVRLLVALSRARMNRRPGNDRQKERFRAAIDKMYDSGIHTPLKSSRPCAICRSTDSSTHSARPWESLPTNTKAGSSYTARRNCWRTPRCP